MGFDGPACLAGLVRSQVNVLANGAGRSVARPAPADALWTSPSAASRPRRIYVAAATGGLWKSTNEGTSWEPLFDRENVASIGDVTVDPTNPDTVWAGSGEVNPRNSVSWGDGVYKFSNGGKTWINVGLKDTQHIGHIVVDPRNPKHIIDGNDGGIDVTWDDGRSWEFLNQLALSQMYSVDVDMRQPYVIYGGAQDYCSWGGPSQTRKTVGIQVSDWFKVQTGDGFQVRVDPTDYTIVYAESQNGGRVRHDLKSGCNTSIKPRARSGQPAYRFNWETPLLISAHDPKTIYVGGNYLFKSTNRGDAWTAISPELTTEKVATMATSGRAVSSRRATTRARRTSPSTATAATI